MSNAIACIDKRFAVKNSGISFLALIFKSSHPSNDNPKKKFHFLGADGYELMARQVAVS